MPTTTTTYSFNKPVVGADEDDWGGYLNGNWDSVDDLLDGTTPVTGIDINSGTIDNVVIGGATPAAGTFTTLTANTSITGTLATAAQPNITSVGTLTGLTVSASASLAGASTTADITFGDNDKAIFGAGSDLQIYHDGSNSYIKDSGTGNLRINAGELTLTNADDNQNRIVTTSDGTVYLYNGGSIKLTTTSTGVDITGTLTSDGLTVATSSAVTASFSRDGSDGDALQIFNGTIGTTKALGLGVSGTHGTINSQYGGVYIQPAGTTSAFFGTGGDISFYEDTGTTAKFFWDASAESLGIGTSSPSAKLDLQGGRTFLQSSSGDQYVLRLTNPANVSGVYLGNPADNSFAVYTAAGSERMRIDSSGNLLVGTTTVPATSNTNGFRVDESGYISLTGAGTAAIDANRSSSDGIIANFRKDGTTVGSIGTNAGQLTVTNGQAGLRFDNVGSGRIVPFDTAEADAAIDLGRSSNRFKDLYLSGGVYLGGTGTANALDDYEEGVWTNPTITFGGGSTGLTYLQRDGWYTKVGRLVTVGWEIVLSNKGSSTGNLALANLPFTIAPSQRQVAGVFYFQFMASNFPAGAKSFYGNANGTNTGGVAYFTGSSGTSSSLNDTHFGNSSYWYGTYTYYVA